jgi:predicted amidohydrolase
MKRKLIYLSSAIVIIIINCLIGYSQSSNQKVRFAGLQMNATADIQKNKERIIEGLRKASDEGADFLITPEGSLSGYTSNFNQDEVSKALPEILAIAKQVKVGLFLGTCFKEISGNTTFCYNQIRVYAPSGEFLGAYSKILRCSPLDVPGTGEMVDYVEGQLKIFEWQGRKIGTLICNDLWATPGYTTIPNPYLAWKLKQMGAEMIVHCINSGSNQQYRKFHESSAELWAMSLKIPILEVNAAQGDEKINAMSGLIGADGIRSKTVPDTGDRFFVVDLP